MVALDSSVNILLFFRPKYDQTEEAQRKAVGFDGMLPNGTQF